MSGDWGPFFKEPSAKQGWRNQCIEFVPTVRTVFSTTLGKELKSIKKMIHNHHRECTFGDEPSEPSGDLGASAYPGSAPALSGGKTLRPPWGISSEHLLPDLAFALANEIGGRHAAG